MKEKVPERSLWPVHCVRPHAAPGGSEHPATTQAPLRGMGCKRVQVTRLQSSLCFRCVPSLAGAFPTLKTERKHHAALVRNTGRAF